MAENKGQSRTARRQQQKKSKKSRKSNKPTWKKVLKIFLFIMLAMFVIGMGVGAYWIATAPDIDEEKLTVPFSSTLLDKNGEQFAELSAEERRTQVSYEDLPDVLIDAVTATEDARFFDHAGVDPRRVGGAILANVTDGFGSQGASTITQQVVERAFLTPEKKVSIKVQEMWLALKLEREYTKEEIMEMYLNSIFYGSQAYGVANAAETYFGKTDLNDLTLPEAAILAGLPQRPSAYNPFENPELTEERMNTVLTLMVRHGKITEEEAEEARQVEVTSLLNESKPDPTPYEAFIQQVRKEVEEKVEDANIDTDGLTIHTTIDPDAQEHVESLLANDGNSINYPEDTQGAIVVLDTQSGAIEAIGGRVDTGDVSGFNYATQGKMQIGSVAKPLLAYGPAIEYNQMSTYHQINDDGPFEIAGSTPIQNYGQYHGWVSARYAVQMSLNVPAAKTIESVGYENAQNFAENLGQTFENNLDVRDVIGGTGNSSNPMKMAGAYRAFGNEGIYNEPYAVTKVEFPDGRTIDLTPEAEPVMEDSTAYMVTDMMRSVVEDGTGSSVQIPGLDIAGKTGTTTLDGADGSPDAWFVGYTTDYTIAAWTGGQRVNEDGGVSRVALTDTSLSREMFRQTMAHISEGNDTANFEKPDSVVEVKVEKGSNPPALASDYTPSEQTLTELFVKGTEPTSVSEKFDQLDAVSGLNATYNEDSNTIDVTWDYDSDEDVSFDVRASIDGGDMQNLSSTEDTSMEISEVEAGAEYVIEVTASKDNMTSEPATTSLTVPGDDEEEIDELPSVSGLSAQYVGDGVIDVSWSYDGPSASFEVSVNGQTQTVQSQGLEVTGASPGEYTIEVTPVSTEDSGITGPPQSTSATVPDESGGNEGDNGSDEGNGNDEDNGNDEGNEDEGNPDQGEGNREDEDGEPDDEDPEDQN
ncbi:transglycosylase domain-containing protein [Oceanobacillus kimchii]|uniref:transglycosylase domain-containing protein n=1 Tax=Oceanobacillus kimchii TaxID=746691 RepID=UPI000984FD3C|nr:PBP1A family penicillin-binding protein [Oceanobacillus kimchii]